MERVGAQSKDYGIEKAFLELKDFLKDAEVGDPKFQAFFDLVREYKLSNEHIERYDNSKKNPNSHWESLLRENEIEASLLEHAIEQKKVTIPGYNRAYTELTDLYEDFSMRISEEAVDKDPNRAVALHGEKHKQMMNEITDEIWARS